MSPCWLCAQSHTLEAKNFHSFVFDHAHRMSITEMAEQFIILYPDKSSKQEVIKHIEEHCLHPSVQISRILRQLLTLSQDLYNITTNRETEDGSPLIDIRSAQSYVKVVNEIIQLYKTTDIKTMLYSSTS
jgi:hypothetical protein